jgi:hypothetical protein
MNCSRFQVDIEKNCWVLTGSDKAGDAVAFVAEMESISRDQAAQLIREWFRVRAPRRMNEKR